MCFCKRCGGGNCKSMPTKEECLCFLSVIEIHKTSVRCITSSLDFEVNCLEIDVLETSFYKYKETYGLPRENEIHE